MSHTRQRMVRFRFGIRGDGCKVSRKGSGRQSMVRAVSHVAQAGGRGALDVASGRMKGAHSYESVMSSADEAT